MSTPSTAPVRLRPRRGRPHLVAVVVAAALALTACSGSNAGEAPQAADTPVSTPTETTPTESAAVVRTSLPAQQRRVPVDHRLELTAEDGTFERVRVRYGPKHRLLAGELSEDETTWTAQQRLEPGARYRIRTIAVDADGLRTTTRETFRAEPLTLEQQTYPSIAPLDGETVGVGMPVIVQFDVAVTDRASIERHLRVESRPRQTGAWHWISDHEVHWRPRAYWQPGTRVTVHADINSVPAGNGIYGQLSRTSSFIVGDAVVAKVDVQAYTMRVYRNGALLRILPISAGKPGFTTRSGTKVIIEKHRTKTMDAATTGISPDDPEYYNIEDVEYALRVTYSGEFLHAAPWSVGSQGSANVSHGCVGMSTADAAWLYGLTKRGDVVETTGSDRWMTLTNGYGDWNVPFAEYRKGSALT